MTVNSLRRRLTTIHTINCNGIKFWTTRRRRCQKCRGSKSTKSSGFKRRQRLKLIRTALLTIDILYSRAAVHFHREKLYVSKHCFWYILTGHLNHLNSIEYLPVSSIEVSSSFFGNCMNDSNNVDRHFREKKTLNLVQRGKLDNS